MYTERRILGKEGAPTKRARRGRAGKSLRRVWCSSLGKPKGSVKKGPEEREESPRRSPRRGATRSPGLSTFSVPTPSRWPALPSPTLLCFSCLSPAPPRLPRARRLQENLPLARVFPTRHCPFPFAEMTRVRNTFRDGQYHRFVLLGKRTVKEGECAAVWTTSGQRHLIRGPRRIHLFFSHVRFLDRFVADQNEFILVQFRDGRKESFRGPLALFFDPCSHEKMKVLPAYKLEANEALVVYKEEELPVSSVSGSRVDGIFPESTSGKSALKPVKDEDAVVGVRIAGVGERGKVVRKIVRGPAVFVPGANEWVHNFSWHGSVGTDNNHLTEQKKPNALKFNKLRIMPNQMYLSVQDVRTTDDAMLTINFMVRPKASSLDTPRGCRKVSLVEHSTLSRQSSTAPLLLPADLLRASGCRGDARLHPRSDRRFHQCGFRRCDEFWGEQHLRVLAPARVNPQ